MSFALKRLSLPGTILQLVHKTHHYRLPPTTTIHTSSHLNSFKSWYRGLWKPRKNEPPYSHIIQVGDPVLRQKSASVPLDAIKSKELNFFIDQLIGVLRNYKLVGIASPQVGIGLNIIVMEFPDRLRKEFTAEEYRVREMKTLPLTVLINPELTVTDYKKTLFPESCGSVIGYSADVPRYAGVTLTGLNRDGEPQKLELNGWNARIAQHEMDHLNGVVFTDVMDRKTFNCTCWHMVNVKQGRLNIPFGPK